METETDIAIVLSFAALVSGLLCGCLVLLVSRHSSRMRRLRSEQSERLLQTAMHAEEKEKERIYNNMHDQINPMLRSLLRKMQWQQTGLKKGKHVAERDLEESMEILETALTDIGSCIHSLMPSFLHEYGFVKTIAWELDQYGTAYHAHVEFSSGISEADPVFPDDNRMVNAYRLMTALMDNVFKHSVCSWCSVKLSSNASGLCIEIHHNGAGISNAQVEALKSANNSVGLRSISARCRMLGANVSFEHKDNPKLKITIPL